MSPSESTDEHHMYINPCPGCGEPGREYKYGTHICSTEDCGVKTYEEKEDWDDEQ